MFDDDEVLRGVALADALASVRASDVNDLDLLELVERWEALHSWVVAEQARVMVELIDRSTGVDGGDPALELGAVLGVSPTAGSLRLGFAHGLSRLPRTGMLLRDGVIDHTRARALVGAVSHLPAEVAAQVEAEALEGLGPHTRLGEVPTARRLRRRAEEVAARLAPEVEARRREHNRRERSATMSVPEAGRGVLTLDGPVDRVAECMSAIGQRAEQARREGAAGSIEALRFDAAVQLLTSSPDGRAPAGRPLLQLVVPFTSLFGFDDAPGHAVALGPLPASAGEPLVLPADVLRELAATCEELERVLTDPVTGLALEAERRRYPFGPRGKAQLRLRDGGCRAPGCDTPPGACDADHVPPWPAGQSVPSHGALECRRHHNGSTHLGFTVTLDGATGIVTWTTPLGGVYTTRPRELPRPGPPVDPDEQLWRRVSWRDYDDPDEWIDETDVLPDTG
jgi:Domain of unknown function (DUF222)